MQFNPKDAEGGLLAEGDAEFEVIAAEDKVSHSGNEMIKLTVKAWDADGKEGLIFDYLLSKAAWKIKGFCEAVGLLEKFELGNLTADDCVNRSGKLNIRTQKDETGRYEDKSTVKKYLKANDGATATKSKSDEPFHDDDIPF